MTGSLRRYHPANAGGLLILVSAQVVRYVSAGLVGRPSRRALWRYVGAPRGAVDVVLEDPVLAADAAHPIAGGPGRRFYDPLMLAARDLKHISRLSWPL